VEKKVLLGDKLIGDGAPCFIIAEAGSNHNGNLAQALKLIELAASAGVDAVKFQLFRAKTLYPPTAGNSQYLNLRKPIFDIIQDMEMPFEWLRDLHECCKENKIMLLASVFDEETADQLSPFVSAFKIASYEMTHFPLIRHVAKKGMPVIISTGTANLSEVEEMVDVFQKTGNPKLILMQCTAAYPAPYESLNIRSIGTMKQVFRVPVGLSDHSRDPLVGPCAAVALGANVVEKHFTLSNELAGPDHRFAVEPKELHQMVLQVRNTEAALGNGEKQMHPVEEELRAFARRSIFASRDIEAHETFTKENTAVLRCGNNTLGLEPKDYDRILGCRAQRKMLMNTVIRPEDYA